MNVIRFSDLAAQGKAKGQRVFIRADLNVPQDDAGHITEDTRIRASVPCIQMALKAGAAVMVTSHLGRPTEGQFKPEDSLAPRHAGRHRRRNRRDVDISPGPGLVICETRQLHRPTSSSRLRP